MLLYNTSYIFYLNKQESTEIPSTQIHNSSTITCSHLIYEELKSYALPTLFSCLVIVCMQCSYKPNVPYLYNKQLQTQTMLARKPGRLSIDLQKSASAALHPKPRCQETSIKMQLTTARVT